MAAPFSTLEVAPKFSDLEVAPKYSDLEHFTTYYHAGLEHDARQPNLTQSHLDSYKETYSSEAPQPRRVCGLPIRVFWIITIIGILVVVGAAIGVGVGTVMASENKSGVESAPSDSGNTIPGSISSTTSEGQSSDSTSPASSGRTAKPTVSSTSGQQLTDSTSSIASQRSSDVTTPTQTSTVPVTTTQIIGPDYTLQHDCPSSNNTIYDAKVGSVNMNFRKVCSMGYLNTLQAIGDNRGDTINAPASSLNGCIDLCASYNVQNATEIATAKSFVCNAVCWRNSLDNDDFPGQCFGFTTQNSSNAFVFAEEVKCDSAAWVDQRILI